MQYSTEKEQYTGLKQRRFLAAVLNTNLVLFLLLYDVIISNMPKHICSFTCTIFDMLGSAPKTVLCV